MWSPSPARASFLTGAVVCLVLGAPACTSSTAAHAPDGGAGGMGDGAVADAGTGGQGSGGHPVVDGGAGASGSGGAAGTGGAPGTGGADGGTVAAHPGFYVSGNKLYDRCGERVVLRGVNKMEIYWDRPGRAFPVIAQSGANAVRIMWNGDSTISTADLETNLRAAIAAQLIPIVGDWDATGDWTKMAAVEAWWTSAAVAAVVNRLTPNLIVNIANEAGQTVADPDWVTTYNRIIAHMRQVGIHALIAVDAAGYGRNVEQLLSLAPQVLAADPDRNVIFDWHEYDGGGAQNARITTAFNTSVSAGLALMVGEFANGGAGSCVTNVPYLFLLAEAQRTGVGTLAWSWDNINSDCQVGNDSIFNMVTDPYDFTTLRAGWPTDVVTGDANSIRNTSVRPRSMVTGSCN